MRIGTSSRSLSSSEQTLATRVFGRTLPSWNTILIDDGLGLGDRPYTIDGPPGLVMIHIGPIGYPDCTSKAMWMGRRIDAQFIHEMTHVWQYAKGYNVKLAQYGHRLADLATASPLGSRGMTITSNSKPRLLNTGMPRE